MLSAIDAGAPTSSLDASVAVDARVAGPPDGDRPALGDAGTSCSVGAVQLEARPIQVMFVLDRSTVMAAAPGPPAGQASGSSRWSISVDAISQVVQGTQRAVAWGLTLFPKGDGAAACCQMPSDGKAAVDVSPDLFGTSIVSALGSATPTGTGTPTAQALLRAGEALAELGSSSKYIVLVTGGEPTCANDTCTAQVSQDFARTKTTVSHVAGVLGIPVGVVAVGLPTSGNAMQPSSLQQFFTEIANLGGMPSPSQSQSSYYAAATATELVSAIASMGAQMKSCSFSLPSPPKWPSDVALQVSGTRVPRDTSHQDGWDYGDDGTAVVLYGKACEGVRWSKTATEVVFRTACPNVVIE